MSCSNALAAMTILITGNDQAMLVLFEQALGMLGFRVLSSGFGDDSHHMVEVEQPNAVIFVVSTLDKCVFDLLKTLKAHKKTAHIPVLASTPHWQDSGEGFFTALGFNGILKQPLELTTISDTIRSFVTPSANT